MTNRNIRVLGAILILSTLVWGCSSNFVTATNPDTFSRSDVVEYFPLQEGYQSTFEITESNSSPEIIVFKVGPTVQFLEDSATIWISQSGSSIDSSYIVVSSSSLLIYESRNSEGEKILDIPLTVGKTWSRYSSISTGDDDDFTIIITDNKLNNDTTNTNDSGVVGKTFPTDGYAEMIVDKYESIQLSNGDYFSNVVRISNDGFSGTRNYYWFAPGVGLVKYVIGATDSDNPSGNIEAELINHGISF